MHSAYWILWFWHWILFHRSRKPLSNKLQTVRIYIYISSLLYWIRHYQFCKSDVEFVFSDHKNPELQISSGSNQFFIFSVRHLDFWNSDIGFVFSRLKKTSLGEGLIGSHAYNPIRDSRRDLSARKASATVLPKDFSRQKVSPRVSLKVLDWIICMTPGETLSETRFFTRLTTPKTQDYRVSFSSPHKLSTIIFIM